MKAIEKINALLLQQGKTGAEMSRDLGLSNSAYSLWNTGSTKPSKKNLKRIADYFGVNVTDIADDPEHKKAKPVTVSDGSKEKYEEIKQIFDSLTDDNIVSLRDYALYLLQRQESQDGQ